MSMTLRQCESQAEILSQKKKKQNSFYNVHFFYQEQLKQDDTSSAYKADTVSRAKMKWNSHDLKSTMMNCLSQALDVLM